MGTCEGNLNKLMCKGLLFLGEIIEKLYNSPPAFEFKEFMDVFGDMLMPLLALCIICKILIWLIDSFIKKYLEKLPFIVRWPLDVLLDWFTDNPAGLLDDAEKLIPWWDKTDCSEFSKGEYSTDYTLWENEQSTEYKGAPPGISFPSPFDNFGPELNQKTSTANDKYLGTIDALCTDGGDCRQAPGSNFGLLSGIGNGNAPRKFAQCCEMNYHFMAKGNGGRMPVWPSECEGVLHAIGAFAGDIGNIVSYAACEAASHIPFYHPKKQCKKLKFAPLVENREKCAFDTITKTPCDAYFNFGGSGGVSASFSPSSIFQNGEKPRGGGILYYQAKNAYNQYINASLIDIPVITGQSHTAANNNTKISCTGTKEPPPECFGKFRPQTAKEKALNSYNYLKDNLWYKQNLFVKAFVFFIIIVIIFYILYVLLIDAYKHCKKLEKTGNLEIKWGSDCSSSKKLSDAFK